MHVNIVKHLFQEKFRKNLNRYYESLAIKRFIFNQLIIINLVIEMVSETQNLIELVTHGYLYAKTAPRWLNGTGYFYMYSPKLKVKKKVKIECSKKEFERTRKEAEKRMMQLWGKKYYVPKKEKPKKSEITLIGAEKEYEKAMAKWVKTSQGMLNFSQSSWIPLDSTSRCTP